MMKAQEQKPGTDIEPFRDGFNRIADDMFVKVDLD